MTRYSPRQIAVASLIVEAQRSLSAFDFGGGQFLSRTVETAMKETERAFAFDDCDRAEHLARVVLYLVQREAPKFLANPAAWIQTRRELRT
ncbi:MAG: hypothetical protein ACLQJ0_09235 [Steroidobacteraceae bacterium]